jgi:hypothetical protein
MRFSLSVPFGTVTIAPFFFVASNGYMRITDFDFSLSYLIAQLNLLAKT